MEIKEYVKIISDKIDSKRVFKLCDELSRFNRIQMSTGYSRAAEYCFNVLKNEGVETRLINIPLEKGTNRLTQKGFDSWDCLSATLVLKPRSFDNCYETTQDMGGFITLCDYEKDPLCIIGRSAPIDITNIEILMINSMDELHAIEPDKIVNKLIFIHNAPWEQICYFALKLGALGIITDYITPNYVRTRDDVYDVRGYFNFFPVDEKEEAKALGFVITPRQGDELKRLFDNAVFEEIPFVCDAQIKTINTPGRIEVVEAIIQGQEDREIIITAHLCHAKPSANDNASGSAGALETIISLNELIKMNKFDKPRFTIKMLLVPEYSGTLAYIDYFKEDIKKIMAAINLDMIGRRQEGKSGLLTIAGPHSFLPSFIIDLMSYIKRLSDCEIPTFNINEFISPFHSDIVEYFGGSDHAVYSDPEIGIPSVVMMQWLDKNYHTGLDTIEAIDPSMLKKSTVLAASWAYSLASIKHSDLENIFMLTRERFLKKLNIVGGEEKIAGASLRDLFDYHFNTYCRAIDDVKRFLHDVDKIVDENKKLLKLFMEQIPEPASVSKNVSETCYKEMRVPVRDINAPLSFVGEPFSKEAGFKLKELKLRYPELAGYNSVDEFILFAMNGIKTSYEIARDVGFESRFYEPEYVYSYIDWLCENGVAHYK